MLGQSGGMQHLSLVPICRLSEKTEASDHRIGCTFDVWQILVAVHCKVSETTYNTKTRESAVTVCSQAAHGS